jgi:hypothetical protein
MEVDKLNEGTVLYNSLKVKTFSECDMYNRC